MIRRSSFLNSVLILSLNNVENWATILRTNFNPACLSCGRPAYPHLDLEAVRRCNYLPNELSFKIEVNTSKARHTLDHEFLLKAIQCVDQNDNETLNLDVSQYWCIKRAYWSMDANMLNHAIASDIVEIGIYGHRLYSLH